MSKEFQMHAFEPFAQEGRKQLPAMLEEEGLYISEAKTEVMVQEKVRKEE